MSNTHHGIIREVEHETDVIWEPAVRISVELEDRDGNTFFILRFEEMIKIFKYFGSFHIEELLNQGVVYEEDFPGHFKFLRIWGMT